MDSTGNPAPGPGRDAPPPPPPSGPDRTADFFDSVRRTGIVRNDDRWIGGVASGVASRLGVDPLLVRAAFGVLVVVSGVGLILYAAGWALLPERSDGRIHLQEAIRGRFDAALAGAAIVLVLGFGDRPGVWGNTGNGWIDGVFWLALVGFAAYLAVSYVQNRSGTWRTTEAHDASTADAAPGASASWGASSPGPQGPVSFEKQGTAPAEPKAPPRRGAGAGAVALVLGLGLLTYAGLRLAERADRIDLDLDTGLVPVAVTVVLTGLAIVVAGLRGRTGGGLSAVAIVGMLVGVSVGSWSGSMDLREATRAGIGDERFEPTTAETARDGYAMGVGDMVLDLTELDLDADETVHIPVQMAVGQLVVILPEDPSASADVSVRIGDARWTVDGADGDDRDDDERSVGGVGIRSASFETQDVADGGEPQIHLEVRHGVGNVIIKEDS